MAQFKKNFKIATITATMATTTKSDLFGGEGHSPLSVRSILVACCFLQRCFI